MRIATIVAFVLVLAPMHFAAAGEVTALRGDMVVEANVVQLGDLFEGAGERAQEVVEAAPLPGERRSYSASELKRIADRFGLSWQPKGYYGRLRLTQASRIVPRSELRRVIAHGLEAQGVEPPYRLSLRHSSARLYMPAEVDAEPVLSDIDIDESRAQFTALVEIPGLEGSGREVVVKGRFERMTEIPVPSRRIERGATIGADDLRWLAVPLKRRRGEIALDKDDAVGLAARRTLPADRPIRLRDLEAPRVVRKGGAVTMSFKRGSLSITVSGRAVEAGGIGDVIRVTNIQSRLTVTAVITGPGMVSVTLPGTSLAEPS